MTTATRKMLFPLWVIIISGCAIAVISFGVRASMGLFLAPMSDSNGWGREVFGMAMAIQNLVWGATQPFAGALADKYGPARVLFVGATVYTIGLSLMASVTEPGTLHLSGGLLIGMGIAGSSFTVVMAAFAKLVSPGRRSLVMSIGTAAGSMGQVLVVPFAGWLIGGFGWVQALFWLSLLAAMMIPLAGVYAGRDAFDGETGPRQSISEALSEAFGHRGYVLLTTGFFVCGFQVAFITVHLPAYLSDNGLGNSSLFAWFGFKTSVAAAAIMFLGLFNIIGVLTAGWIGGRYSKRITLAYIYLGRSIVTTAYLLTPITEANSMMFAMAMGLLWLATVPLTYSIVGQVFGIRFMTMLTGFTFLSHQLGSFLGVWGGGYLYEMFGTYDPVWWGGVALGILAAIIHWPIDERPIQRLQTAAS